MRTLMTPEQIAEARTYNDCLPGRMVDRLCDDAEIANRATVWLKKFRDALKLYVFGKEGQGESLKDDYEFTVEKLIITAGEIRELDDILRWWEKSEKPS